MNPGRVLLFDAAKTFCRDRVGVEAARDFLQFKLSATNHAREKILMVVTHGLTSLTTVIDPATGSPTDEAMESHDAFAVMELRMWFDLLLFELASVKDAVTQAVNVVFEFGEDPRNTRLIEVVHGRIRSELESKHSLLPPASEATGLQDWIKPKPWLQDVLNLRNEATHRNLITLREAKPWDATPRPTPPFPGYLRSECYVDFGDGREEPIGEWAALTVDKVRDLVNSSAKRLADVLTLLRP